MNSHPESSASASSRHSRHGAETDMKRIVTSAFAVLEQVNLTLFERRSHRDSPPCHRHLPPLYVRYWGHINPRAMGIVICCSPCSMQRPRKIRLVICRPLCLTRFNLCNHLPTATSICCGSPAVGIRGLPIPSSVRRPASPAVYKPLLPVSYPEFHAVATSS